MLPDVIEHIPVEQHKKLFANISSVLKKDGFILIHIPQPYYQEWCFKNKPEALQVIDQAIYTDQLAQNVYPNKLFISHLETYSIWKQHGDYQVIVLKPYRTDLSYDELPPTLAKKVKGKTKQLMKKIGLRK